MKKILLVEDDMAWSQVITDILRDEYEIRGVQSAGQAMAIIDEWKPDTIVLDMLLAGETGVALLNEMRSHVDLVELPIIVCSSVDFNDEQLKPFGVSKVLNKSSMRPEDLRQSVLEVLP